MHAKITQYLPPEPRRQEEIIEMPDDLRDKIELIEKMGLIIAFENVCFNRVALYIRCKDRHKTIYAEIAENDSTIDNPQQVLKSMIEDFDEEYARKKLKSFGINI